MPNFWDWGSQPFPVNPPKPGESLPIRIGQVHIHELTSDVIEKIADMITPMKKPYPQYSAPAQCWDDDGIWIEDTAGEEDSL